MTPKKAFFTGKSLLITLFGLFSVFSVWGQAKTFHVHGRLLSDSLPVPQAEIYLHELNRELRSDSLGNYRFTGIRPGAYHLHITAIGYEAIIYTFHVRNADVRLDFTLKPSSFQLREVLVEANPFKSGPLEHSLSIEVVDRKFIEKNGAGTFANSLEKIPGISTINTGVGISKPVLRGMSFNRIMVNDRGIKQEGQQWGADHGLEIDPFDVDRVEIIKGPASLIYGSDGMGGVININPAPLPSDNEIRGHVISNYRSNNDLYAQSAMLEGNQGDFVFKARFTAQDFGDYRVPASQFNYASYILPIYDEKLKNTAGSERHFSVMGGLRKSWGYSTVTVSRFSQQAGLFPGAIGIPTSYSLQHRGENRNVDLPNQRNSHLKIISNTNIKMGKNWLEVDLGYQQNKREEMSLPHTHGVGPTPSGNLALGLDLQTLSANARYHMAVNGKYKGIVGGQLQYMTNAHEGFEFLIPHFQTAMGGLYYYHEYRWKPNFIINGGLRVDGALHEIEEHLQPIYRNRQPTGEFDQRNPDISRQYANLSGSAGFSYIFSSDWNLKFNLGSSFRVPTAVELSMNGVHHGNFRHELGNANLNSERGYQSDVALQYNGKRFYTSLSPFVAYYDDYIYLAPTGRFSPLPAAGAFWEYRQHNAVFAGGEWQMNYLLLPGLKAGVGLEYVWNINLDTRLPLPLTPPFSTLINVEYNLKRGEKWLRNAYVFAEMRYAADQMRTDRNERTTEGYSLFEAGLGMDISVYGVLLQWQLRAQNLTDAVYFNHLSRYRLLNIPEQGRNISISLKIPFCLTCKSN